MTVTINGTTGIAGTNGSAGTPAVQGEDTNTGVFFPAADTVAVTTGGSERMRVDSAGNVGIGETSPTHKLEVKAANARISAKDSGGTYFVRMVASGSFAYTGLEYKSLFTFSDDGTERARIDSSGNLLVGTTDSGLSGTNTGIWVRGALGLLQVSRNSDPSLNLCRLTSDGAIATFAKGVTTVGNISVTGSATAYNTSSDYRLKENVAPMQNALDTIAQLNPVTYTWKADGSDGQGFIAHELQAVVPDCVTGEKDAVDAEGNPQYQGVDTSFLVATLVKAVQELTARVAELENK